MNLKSLLQDYILYPIFYEKLRAKEQ